MAGAALLLGACSTTAAIRQPADLPVAQDQTNEKPVTYKELHGMMVRLAEEPTVGAAIASTTSTAGSVDSRTLATNP